MDRYIEENHIHRCIRMRKGLDSQRYLMLSLSVFATLETMAVQAVDHRWCLSAT